MTTVAHRAIHWLWVAVLAAGATGCDPDIWCSDGCRFARDGECDDGRPGAVTGLCAIGTDCSDCGANPNFTSSSDIDGTRPIPGFSRDGARDYPAPPGTGTCECPADAYCGYFFDPDLYEGTPGFETCGGGGPVCATSSWRCPSVGGADWDSEVVLVCRDGDQGLGCYVDGDDEACIVEGQCLPPEDYGITGVTLDGSPPEIRHCFRYASYLPLRLAATAGTSWDSELCDHWYQVADYRHSCGACGGGCGNTWLSPGGANPCADYYRGLESDPDTPLSPSCRAAIDAAIRMARDNDLYPRGPCFDTCVDSYATCLEGTDCNDGGGCANRFSMCATRCV